jgi:NTE family protein
MQRRPTTLRDGFTLALGGGGARGWAHVGVARALQERGLHPTRIVGTSMGGVVGAGLAAGYSPAAIEEFGRRTPLYRHVRGPGRFALFDPRPLLERLAREMNDPRIEDLPLPLAITAYDLVRGRPTFIARGRLVDALERSIAVPLFFPPCSDAEGVWCDAGPWEAVPVSVARAWAPDLPVVGVHVDAAKPPFLASRYGAFLLRRVAARLGVAAATPAERLTARRYLALLASRWADPVHLELPELLIAPRLRFTNALQFGRIGPFVEAGYRDALTALAAADGLIEPPGAEAPLGDSEAEASVDSEAEASVHAA